MEQTKSKLMWQVVALGILAGMRANSAPAIAAHILSRRKSKRLEKSPLRFMQNDKVAVGLKVLAAGELIGDKLPTAPNRIEPGGVIFRVLAGSLAGASIFKANGDNIILGGVIGGFTAIGATYGSYYLRKEIVGSTKIDDPIIGAIEDSLVIGAGIALIRNS